MDISTPAATEMTKVLSDKTGLISDNTPEKQIKEMKVQECSEGLYSGVGQQTFEVWISNREKNFERADKDLTGT